MTTNPKPPKSKPRRWRRRILWALSIFVGLIVILRVSISAIIPAILNKAAKTYNLTCDYDRLELNLLGGHAAVWNLTFSPREGGDPLFRADYCEGDISLLRLLRGKLVVYRAAADGVEMTFERKADGQIPILARFASSSVPSAQPTTVSPPQPIELEPPLRVDAFRLEHVRARFHDEFIRPEVDTQMALDVRVSDLGKTGQPTHFEVDFSSNPLLDSLEIYGTGNGDGKTLAADLHVLMRGLHPKPAAGYLAMAGLRPTADDISASLDGAITASVAPNPIDGIRGNLTLTNARLTCDGRTAAAMDRLSVEALSLAPGSANLGKFQISGVRVTTSRNENGNLAALGVEVFPTPRPTAIAAMPPASSQSPGSIFRWSVQQFALQDFHATFADQSISPAVVTGLDVQQVTVDNLVCDPDHPESDAHFHAVMSAPGLIRSIDLQGDAKPFADGKTFSLTAQARGVAPTAIGPYLNAAGIASEWRDGSLGAAADGTFQVDRARIISISAHLGKFNISDGKRLLDIKDANVTDASIDLSSNTIHVNAIDISGPSIGIERDAGGDFHVMGFKTIPRTPISKPPAIPVVQSQSSPGAPTILPNVEIDRFSWKDIHLNITDNAVQPPTSIDVSDAGLTAENIALYLSGDHQPSRKGTINGWVSVPGVVRSASLKGTVISQAGQSAIALDLRASGIIGHALTPYLKAVGAESTWKDAALDLHGGLNVRQLNGRLIASLDAHDWNFTDEGQSLASLAKLGITGLQSAPNEVGVEKIEVDLPRIRATRLADGTLNIAGIHFLAAEAQADPAPQVSAIPASQPMLDLDLQTLHLSGATLDWTDHSVTPSVNTTASLGADLENFHFGSASSPAKIQLTANIAGLLDNLAAQGTLEASAHKQSINLNILASGIRAGPAQAYLPPNLISTLKAGLFRTTFDFSSRDHPVGGRVLDMNVSGLDFRDATDAAPLVAFESFHVGVARFDPAAKIVALDDLTLKNFDANIRKTSTGLAILGLEIRSNAGVSSHPSAPQAKIAPPPAPLAPPPTTQPNVLAQIAEQRGKLPLVSIKTLNLGARKITLVDETVPNAAPLVISGLFVNNTNPIFWLGRDTEANPPTDLRITGRIDPIADALKINLHTTPFARQKTLAADFSLTGIHGDGLIALRPELASQIDVVDLKSGQLTASLNATLKLQTVKPTDFSLRYGGKLDFDVKDINFRSDPSGPVLGGVGEIRSDGIVLKPDSGGVEIPEMEIDNIVGSAIRNGKGIHAFGLTIKPPPASSSQPSSPPAEPTAPVPAVHIVAELKSAPEEIKIDRLLVSGMDFHIEDQTASPPFICPINGFDLEAQGLSSLAFTQTIPIRFNLLVSAAKVPLPSQQSGFARLENRELFSQMTSSGAVTLYPDIKGWAKAAVNGFELTSLYGIARQNKVKLGAGTFDGDLDVRFPGDGSADSSTRLVLTDLSLSEPPDGFIAKTLKLPAPLDLVIVALQDQDGSITVPLNVRLQQGKLDSGAVTASAVGALGQVIATALASSPLKIASLVGLGGGKDNKQLPVVVTFPTGYSQLDPQAMAILNQAVQRLKNDKSLDATIRHDLGSDDIALVSERSNPTSDDALALANSLNRRRDDLLAARLSAASDVRAFLASAGSSDAQQAIERLRTIDRQLADTDNALDKAYDFLRAGADRQAMRRTRSAGLAIAKSRIEAVRQYLLIADRGAISPQRIHLANPQFNPAQGNSPGTVTIILVKAK